MKILYIIQCSYHYAIYSRNESIFCFYSFWLLPRILPDSLVFDQLSLGAFTLEYNLFPCIDYGDLFVFKVLEMEVPSVC